MRVMEADDGISISDYELQRQRLIEENTRVLARLGLDVHRVTAPRAPAGRAPAVTKRPRTTPPPCQTRVAAGAANADAAAALEHVGPAGPVVYHPRRSSRIKAKSGEGDDGDDGAYGKAGRSQDKTPAMRPQKVGPERAVVHALPAAGSSRSTRALRVSHQRLATFLGAVITPQGGQVKKSVMDTMVEDEGRVTFSRMSGIQEWRNGIFLFVNVYGAGYKNVFLEDGRRVTWFAQQRHGEHSPLIQRIISMQRTNRGDENSQVYLFCRLLNEGYVACGKLNYLAHDPDRIPLRFVFELADYSVVNKSENFRRLIRACHSLFA